MRQGSTIEGLLAQRQSTHRSTLVEQLNPAEVHGRRLRFIVEAVDLENRMRGRPDWCDGFDRAQLLLLAKAEPPFLLLADRVLIGLDDSRPSCIHDDPAAINP